MRARRFPSTPAAIGQILVVALALVVTALLPPAHGAMLAIPLTAGRAADAVDVALAHGATVDGRGRLASWTVIRGDRAALAGPLWAHRILLIAAPSMLCG